MLLRGTCVLNGPVPQLASHRPRRPEVIAETFFFAVTTQSMGPSVFKLRAPIASRWRGRFVSRFGFRSGGSFERAVDGRDRGSSGCPAPGGRLVRRLCPGLPMPRAGWLRDCGSCAADRERFEIRSFDACRRPLMWLVEEWTRHESGTSVLVEPLSWGKSRSRDTTARAVASHGAARGCPRTPWNSMSMIPVRDTPRTHLVPKRSLSAPDDPQSSNQPARSTGKMGHNRRTGRPRAPRTRMTRDHRRQGTHEGPTMTGPGPRRADPGSHRRGLGAECRE